MFDLGFDPLDISSIPAMGMACDAETEGQVIGFVRMCRNDYDNHVPSYVIDEFFENHCNVGFHELPEHLRELIDSIDCY